MERISFLNRVKGVAGSVTRIAGAIHDRAMALISQDRGVQPSDAGDAMAGTTSGRSKIKLPLLRTRSKMKEWFLKEYQIRRHAEFSDEIESELNKKPKSLELYLVLFRLYALDSTKDHTEDFRYWNSMLNASVNNIDDDAAGEIKIHRQDIERISQKLSKKPTGSVQVTTGGNLIESTKMLFGESKQLPSPIGIEEIKSMIEALQVLKNYDKTLQRLEEQRNAFPKNLEIYIAILRVYALDTSTDHTRNCEALLLNLNKNLTPAEFQIRNSEIERLRQEIYSNVTSPQQDTKNGSGPIAAQEIINDSLATATTPDIDIASVQTPSLEEITANPDLNLDEPNYYELKDITWEIPLISTEGLKSQFDTDGKPKSGKVRIPDQDGSGWALVLTRQVSGKHKGKYELAEGGETKYVSGKYIVKRTNDFIEINNDYIRTMKHQKALDALYSETLTAKDVEELTRNGNFSV